MKLCGQRSKDTTSVLIGRFVVVDAYGKGRPELESIIASSVAGALFPSSEISAHLWTSDGAEGRLYASVQPLIGSIFLNGSDLSDPNIERRSNELSNFLLDNDCDFLAGGQVTIDNGLTVLAPYILDPSKKKIERPFGPLVRSRASWAQLGSEFADKLQDALLTRMKREAKKVSIINVCNSNEEKTEGDPELVKHITAEIKAEANLLASSSSILLPEFLLTKCSLGDGPTADGHATLVIDSGSQRGSDYFLLPVKGEGGQKFVKIRLEVVSGPQSDVPRNEYVPSTASVFIVAITQPDGSIPFVSSDLLRRSEEDLDSTTEALLKQGRPELGNLLALVAAGEQRDVPDALLALGRGLAKKSLFLQSAAVLQRAAMESTKIPVARQALLYESLGITLESLGSPAEALPELKRAKLLYRDIGAQDIEERLARIIAKALLQAGDPQKAEAELRSASHLNDDSDALQLLGQIALVENRFEYAEGLLQKSLNVSPNNSSTRRLLAELKARKGEELFATNDFKASAVAFSEAMDLEPGSKTIYQAGLALFKAGSYDRAILLFRAAVDKSFPDKTATWVEASWLMLLQTQLISNDASSLKTSASAAQYGLAQMSEASAIAIYIQEVGRVVLLHDLSNVDRSIDIISNMRQTIDRKTLQWDNSDIDNWIRAKHPTTDQQKALDRLKTAAFFS